MFFLDFCCCCCFPSSRPQRPKTKNLTFPLLFPSSSSPLFNPSSNNKQHTGHAGGQRLRHRRRRRRRRAARGREVLRGPAQLRARQLDRARGWQGRGRERRWRRARLSCCCGVVVLPRFALSLVVVGLGGRYCKSREREREKKRGLEVFFMFLFFFFIFFPEKIFLSFDQRHGKKKGERAFSPPASAPMLLTRVPVMAPAGVSLSSRRASGANAAGTTATAARRAMTTEAAAAAAMRRRQPTAASACSTSFFSGSYSDASRLDVAALSASTSYSRRGTGPQLERGDWRRSKQKLLLLRRLLSFRRQQEQESARCLALPCLDRASLGLDDLFFCCSHLPHSIQIDGLCVFLGECETIKGPRARKNKAFFCPPTHTLARRHQNNNGATFFFFVLNCSPPPFPSP